MDRIDAGVGLIGDFLRHSMPDGALRDLLARRQSFGGVGGVIVFLRIYDPLLLHLFDGRYRLYGPGVVHSWTNSCTRSDCTENLSSRCSWVSDATCRQSWATRTIESRKDRVLTNAHDAVHVVQRPFAGVVLLIFASFRSQGPGLVLDYMLGYSARIISALC